MSPDRSRLLTLCLWLQCVGGLVWFVCLLAIPDIGTWFLPSEVDPDLIHTFLAADLVFFALLPGLAAVGLRRTARWAWPTLWMHVGGIVYAALWGWGLYAQTGDGVLGAALMTPGAVVIPALAWRASRAGPADA